MKILLTGGTGMVGSNILEHSSSNKYSFLAPTSHELDLLDRHAVQEFLSREIPDLIIHSAGLVGGIEANIKSPVDFLSKLSLHNGYAANVRENCIYYTQYSS